MPTMTQAIDWLQSGEGRLLLALVLFAAMWAITSWPWVRKKLLKTHRRKQLASWFLLLPPSVWLIADGAPWLEVATSAMVIVLAANGVSTYRPSQAGK